MALGKELADFVTGFKAGGEFVDKSREANRKDREQKWREEYYDRNMTETERRNRASESESERTHREQEARNTGFDSDDQRRRFEQTKGGGTFGDNDLDAAAKGIRTIESGSPEGNYNARGKVTKTGDRAYGAYQVMGANVPSWTKAHFGKSLTPEEFLQNRDAQDAVFKGEFGNYMKKYGPTGAAQAWFGGEKSVGKRGVYDPVSKRDTGSYADQFTSLYDKHGGGNAERRVPTGKVETTELAPPAAAKPEPQVVPFEQSGVGVLPMGPNIGSGIKAEPQQVSYLEPDEEELEEPTVYAAEGGVIPDYTPNAGPGMSTAAASIGTEGFTPVTVAPKRISMKTHNKPVAPVAAPKPMKPTGPFKASTPGTAVTPGANKAVDPRLAVKNGAADAKASLDKMYAAGANATPLANPVANGMAGAGGQAAPVGFSGAWNAKTGAAPTVANMDQAALDALPDGYFANMAANIATSATPGQTAGIAEWQKQGLIDYARWRLGQGTWNEVSNRALASAREQSVRMNEHARGGMVKGYAEGGYVDDPDDESAWDESDPTPVPTRPVLAPAADGETRAAQEAARARLAQRQEEYRKAQKSEKAKQEEEDEKDEDETEGGITGSTQPPPKGDQGQKTATDRKVGVVPDDEGAEAIPASWQDQPAPTGGVALSTEPPPRGAEGRVAPADRRLGVVPEGEAAEAIPAAWQDQPEPRGGVPMSTEPPPRGAEGRLTPSDRRLGVVPDQDAPTSWQDEPAPPTGAVLPARSGRSAPAPQTVGTAAIEAATEGGGPTGRGRLERTMPLPPESTAATPAATEPAPGRGTQRGPIKESRTKDDRIEPAVPKTDEKPVVQTDDPASTSSTSPTGGPTKPETARAPSFIGPDAQVALQAGLKNLQRTYTEHDPQQDGPVPTPQAKQEKLKRFATNTDAPPEKLIREVFERIDPEHKLDQEQKMMKSIQDQYDFWIAEGRPDRAAASVASMLSYSKKAASTYGSLAQAAFEKGDNIAGLQILSRAYAVIPDGRSLRVDPYLKDGKPDPKHDGMIGTYQIIDRNTGEVVDKGNIDPKNMSAMSAKLADGSGWMQTMMTAAQSVGKPGKGPTTYEQRQGDRTATAEAARDLTEKLEAARENPDDEQAQKAAQEASKRLHGMVGNDDMGRRQMQYAYRGAGYEDKDIPAEYRPTPKTGRAPDEGSVGERQEKGDKAIREDTAKRLSTEQDTGKRYQIQMEGMSKLYDRQKELKPNPDRIAEAIPEDVDDNDGLYSSVMQEIMRKNSVNAKQAAMFIDSVRRGEKAQFTEKGTVRVPGLDRDIFANDSIFRTIVTKLPRLAAKV